MNPNHPENRLSVCVLVSLLVVLTIAPLVSAQWPCGQGYVLRSHDLLLETNFGLIPPTGPNCDGTPVPYGTSASIVILDGGYHAGNPPVYATRKTLPFSTCTTNYLNQLSITFPQANSKVTISLTGKEGDVLTVTDNTGDSMAVTLHSANIDDPPGAFVTLLHDGISAITITSSDPDWYFGITDLDWQFCESENPTPTPTPSPLPGENNGKTGCNAGAGDPVNVTTGNMYLEQTDFQLPGAGEAIDVTRTYNSSSQDINLFGRGWSSPYDRSVQTINSQLKRLNLGDGRSVYFVPSGTAGVFVPLEPDFRSSLTANNDGTTTVVLKDGRIYQFNSAGRLAYIQDLNGNQTVMNYTSGALASIVDPFGRTIIVTTDGNGQVVSLSDSIGTIASYAYGSSQELSSVTYPDGSGYQFNYTQQGSDLLLSSVTDALGNIVSAHTYDNQGRAISSEREGGMEHFDFEYLTPNETKVTDGLGRVGTYQFLNIHGRKVVTRIAGACTCGGSSEIKTWNYDDQLNLVSQVDGLGHKWIFTHDSNGNMTGKADNSGLQGFYSYTYNSRGQMLTSEDSLGDLTTLTYDTAGNLLSREDALNNTRSFTYDAHGQLLTATDERGKITTFTWDSNGRLTQVKDALNHTTDFARDARARITSVTNALNETTSFTYDSANRLKRSIHPDSTFSEISYDLAGRPTTYRNERDNTTQLTYDGAYRVTARTDALDRVTTYEYDSMSEVTGVTDALGQPTNYEYDGRGRLKKVTYPPATTGATRLSTTFTYDAVGNVLSQTDTAGRISTFAYDLASRLTRQTRPDDTFVQIQYDALSRTTAVTDAANQQYQFQYDALSRRTQTTRAGVSATIDYDAAGNRAHRTDYNGATTTYAYDDLSRLTGIAYPNSSSVSYGYDALSRLTSAANENGTVSLSYNNRGWVSSSTDVFNKTIGYAYDEIGNRTDMTLDGSPYAAYVYDKLDRMANVSSDSRVQAEYTYDELDRITKRGLINGVESNYEYDGLSRLTRIQHQTSAEQISDVNYTFDAAGRIREQLENVDNSSQTYEYDLIDRLVGGSHTDGSNIVVDASAGLHGPPPNGHPQAESYSYDAVGNRTAASGVINTSYTYGSFNRLTSTNLATFTSDSNGNTTTKTDGNGTRQYLWDFENRLTQVTLPGGFSVSYKYDALGRRILRDTNESDPEKFVYDGHDVVQDLDNSGQVVTSYLNEPGLDKKIRQNNGRLSYFHADQVGSIIALTDNDGNLTSLAGYDSFGHQVGRPISRYSFTGRELDTDTDLYYYRARWYDSEIGRFISEDPIGLNGGENFYAYVGNSPPNFSDPYGLCPYDPNKRLARCYWDAIQAYDHADPGTFVAVMKFIAPTNSVVGGVTGAINGFRSATTADVIATATSEGFQFRSVPPTFLNRLSGGGTGLLRGGLGSLPGYVGAVGTGVGIGSSGVVLGDSLFGKEAFLRQALDECNRGTPDATNKIEPSFFQNPIGPGNVGAARTVAHPY